MLPNFVIVLEAIFLLRIGSDQFLKRAKNVS